MIKMLTLWPLPDFMSEAQFEEYFELCHSVNARVMEGFRRYAVNRRLRQVPAVFAGPQVAHHISENWWDSVSEIERCFNSWGGLADLGDTIALHGAAITPMMFMRMEQFTGPAFSAVDLGVARGGGVPHCAKVFGLLTSEADDRFETWLAANRTRLTAVPGFNRLAVGRTVDDICQLGWPHRRQTFPPGPPPFSRSLEMWFDDSLAVEAAFQTGQGRAVLSSLTDAGLTPRWAVMNNQDVYFCYDLVAAGTDL